MPPRSRACPEPKVRPFIERFFGTLTNSVIQKLPGTTGSTLKSSAAKRGGATSLAHLITMAELEALLHVTIANYHATPHDGLNGLNGRTPLEALQATLPSTAPSIRKLPPHMQARLHQLQLVHISTVHGSAARAIAPYISLFGARYSSDVLARTAGLIAESIRVFIRPDDMREAWAYLPNGAELGRLTV